MGSNDYAYRITPNNDIPNIIPDNTVTRMYHITEIKDNYCDGLKHGIVLAAIVGMCGVFTLRVLSR